MKKPTISFIIVTHNRKELLRECLESIKNQTYKDYEIVLVDDGSTDGTSELSGLVNVYHYQKHGGISKARNKALELMGGDYFFVMDSDDKITPDCLEKHVDKIQQTGADLVFPHFEMFGDGTKPTVVEYIIQDFGECYVEKRIPHPGLYRSSTLRNFRYDETLTSAVDYDYILNILSSFHEIKMAVINTPVYQYRIGHKQERNTPAQIISVGIIRTKYGHFYSKL